MKKLSADFKKGVVKVKIENADDLWYLSQLIEKNDLVSGKTMRKLKLGGEEDRKQKVIKKPVFLKIKTEKIEFSESTTELRVLGTIEEGSEDLPKGEHHTFSLEENSEITIEKKWLKYQIKKINESFSSKPLTSLIVVFDREEAYFARMKKSGFEILAQLKGNVAKKDVEVKSSNFYTEIIAKMKELNDRLKPAHIIVASPAFWKDELLKNLKDEELKKNMVLATCSAVGKNAISEVLKRDEVKKVLKEDRTTRELNFVEELMKAINDKKAAYGLSEVEEAANAGAIKTLLVTDALIQKLRSEDNFEQLDTIMKIADSTDADIHIISHDNEAGKKLDGLTGVGAMLRYQLQH